MLNAIDQERTATAPEASATARTYLRAFELRRFTGFQFGRDQAEWLRANAVPFLIGKTAMPLVARSAWRERCSAIPPDADSATREKMAQIARVFMAPMRHVVYVVDEGDDESHVKFGMTGTESVSYRIICLQTGNPRRLRPVYHAPGSAALELLIHRTFVASSVSGEWFRRCDNVRRFIGVAVDRGYRQALETLALT